MVGACARPSERWKLCLVISCSPQPRTRNVSNLSKSETYALSKRHSGLTLLQNTEARGYYENKTKGDFVVQLKGPYDLALKKQPDGTYGLTADLWNGHVEKEVGQG